MDEKRLPTAEELTDILSRFNMPGLTEAKLQQFKDEEDGSPCAVWLVPNDGERFVLKRAKGQEAVFGIIAEIYRQTPRSLCHDDLLPFNLLVGERAVLIDREYGGVLPYPGPLARLSAHRREDENAFFFLKRADRDFAIEYYYRICAEKHGISYAEYRRTLDFFLFYKACEWIMLGNRYDQRGDERYRYSLRQAEVLADRLL